MNLVNIPPYSESIKMKKLVVSLAIAGICVLTSILIQHELEGFSVQLTEYTKLADSLRIRTYLETLDVVIEISLAVLSGLLCWLNRKAGVLSMSAGFLIAGLAASLKIVLSHNQQVWQFTGVSILICPI